MHRARATLPSPFPVFRALLEKDGVCPAGLQLRALPVLLGAAGADPHLPGLYGAGRRHRVQGERAALGHCGWGWTFSCPSAWDACSGDHVQPWGPSGAELGKRGRQAFLTGVRDIWARILGPPKRAHSPPPLALQSPFPCGLSSYRRFWGWQERGCYEDQGPLLTWFKGGFPLNVCHPHSLILSLSLKP